MKVDYRMQYYDVITNPRWLQDGSYNFLSSGDVVIFKYD